MTGREDELLAAMMSMEDGGVIIPRAKRAARAPEASPQVAASSPQLPQVLAGALASIGEGALPLIASGARPLAMDVGGLALRNIGGDPAKKRLGGLFGLGGAA